MWQLRQLRVSSLTEEMPTDKEAAAEARLGDVRAVSRTWARTRPHTSHGGEWASPSSFASPEPPRSNGGTAPKRLTRGGGQVGGSGIVFAGSSWGVRSLSKSTQSIFDRTITPGSPLLGDMLSLQGGRQGRPKEAPHSAPLPRGAAGSVQSAAQLSVDLLPTLPAAGCKLLTRVSSPLVISRKSAPLRDRGARARHTLVWVLGRVKIATHAHTHTQCHHACLGRNHGMC